MDERIITPLPVWISAQDGTLVNLSTLTSISLSEADRHGKALIQAHVNGGGSHVLLRVKEDMGYSALTKLSRLLPIAIVDMELDVLEPVEQEAADEAQASGAAE